MTTIVSVRRNGQVVVGGDGQVSLGNTVMKGNARKVRRLYNGKFQPVSQAAQPMRSPYLNYLSVNQKCIKGIC